MPDREQPSPGSQKDRTGDTVNFSNADNARIGQQFGVIHGDVTQSFNTESLNPDEQFTVGKTNLDAGAARAAEKYFALAFERSTASQRTGELRFFYALSIISDRTKEELFEKHLEKLQEVFAGFDCHGVDGFDAGISAIEALLRALIAAEVDTPREETEIGRALAAFDQVPADLQSDLYRHADLLISGAIQNELEATEDRLLKENRLGNNRSGRIHKFFIPDPREPIRHAVIGFTRWPSSIAALILTAVLAVVAPALILSPASGSLTVADWLLVVTFAFCTAAVIAVLGRVTALRERDNRRRKLHEHTSSYLVDLDLPSSDPAAVLRFCNYLVELFQWEFSRRAPADTDEAARWYQETQGILVSRTNDAIWTYGHVDIRNPERLGWLARFYATAVADSWSKGTFGDYRKRRSLPGREVLAGAAVTVVSAAVALLVLLRLNTRSAINYIALGFALLVVVGYLARKLLIARYVEYDGAEQERRRRKDEFDDECAAFAREVAYLQDRPSDADMGAWLDMDTRFAKNEALKLYRLRGQDVVTHLILTESLEPCLKARVKGGPARYSDYRVTIFLLTDSGVRQQSIDLHFLQGLLGDQHRMSFRYEVLASARVVQEGLRFAAGQRAPQVLDQSKIAVRRDPRDQQRHPDEFVFAQSFQLRLTNGEPLTIRIENYEAWYEQLSGEDLRSLIHLAVDTSGISTALQVLEAVAAEGSHWIDKERQRLRRSLSDQQERLRKATAPFDPLKIDTTRALPGDTIDASGHDSPGLAIELGELQPDQDRDAQQS